MAQMIEQYCALQAKNEKLEAENEKLEAKLEKLEAKNEKLETVQAQNQAEIHLFGYSDMVGMIG